ncbi:hypothetical protein ILUMI_20548 [Ignelater luminosus]|uniref:RING-type E3 ubiquitin transferase n=1 Tax=Ignelater luminosus TaxID=2038154 RepID=A0A8K0CH77_IGNLU|nr:hypothetical protein ILUMI_20548 [Ignelater luminosus]
MADNPNISSARSNFHGGGTPRRNGAQHNQRVMNFGDSDFRRYRNHNFQSTRSSPRTRPERPQTSSNRNSNRNRSERPLSFRNYSDRFNSENYSEQENYSNGGGFLPRRNRDTNKSESSTETENRREQRRNGETVEVRNEDNYFSEVNIVDQQIPSFIKQNDNSEQLLNPNGEVPNQVGLPISQDIAECLNVSQVPKCSIQDTEEEALKLDDMHTKASATPYLASRPASSEPPTFENSAMGELGFNLAADNSKSIQNNLPRAIRGRASPIATATGGLPRPITKQNLNSANDTEANPDLPHTLTSGALHEEWANAPEFVPKGSKPKSYAEVVNPKTGSSESISKKLCPYTEKHGECRVPPGCCPYLHGDICDLCGNAVLHPADTEQRKNHHQKCLARHEREMEISFAVARSKEKTCGICFEVVVEKQLHERRFGILTQCNHCFCLGCIRKWRQARQFEHKVVRACPECRVTSDFVCPSVYWVETKEEKDKLIENYKNALAEKQCKYFKQGRGSCPFGNKCFYLHALPDGTKTDVGPPPRRRRPNRNRHNDDTELGDMLQQIILWDFLDEHDHHWLYSFADDIEELVAFFSDSDESESWSDYEFLLD